MTSNNVEVCSQCGRKFYSHDQACIIDGNIVCPECDRKLRSGSELLQSDLTKSDLSSDRIELTSEERENITEDVVSEILGLDVVETPLPTDISISGEVEGAATNSSSDVAHVEKKYKGVGGWLLFLCIYLTILCPLSNLAHLVVVFIQNIGLIIFSIYAGHALWTIRANAVNIAKTFFGVAFASAIVITFLLPLILGLPPEVRSEMRVQSQWGLNGVILAWWIWCSYLKRSKRVKATYKAPDV